MRKALFTGLPIMQTLVSDLYPAVFTDCQPGRPPEPPALRVTEWPPFYLSPAERLSKMPPRERFLVGEHGKARMEGGFPPTCDSEMGDEGSASA